MKRIPTRERVLEDLAPFLPKLVECIVYGFNQYATGYDPGIRVEHGATAQAVCIHDHMIARARSAFQGVTGARVQVFKRMEVISLHQGRYVVRLKKLDHRGYASNIETQQCSRFDAQQQLPGMPAKSVNLRAGYVTDRGNTKILALLLACPMGKRVAWIAQIGEGSVKVQPPGEQADLPVGPSIKIRPKTGPSTGNVIPLKRGKRGV